MGLAYFIESFMYIEDDRTDNSLSNYQKRCNGDNGKNCKNLVVEYLEVQLADEQAVIGTTASQVKTRPTRMIFNLAMIL